jgi:hypothetical protein
MAYTYQSPTLEPFAAWKAHAGCVHDLVTLPEGCALSVSADALALHTAGGVLRMRVPQRKGKGGGQEAAGGGKEEEVEEEWMCCALEPGQAHSRVLVGGSSGAVSSIDLVGSKRAGQVRRGWCYSFGWRLCLSQPTTTSTHPTSPLNCNQP